MKYSFYVLLIFILNTPCQSIELSTAYRISSGGSRWINTDQQKEYSGICADVIHELERRVLSKDISIKIKYKGVPFKRIKKYLKEHAIDFYVCITKNKAREAIYTFLDKPVLMMQYAFAANKSSHFDYEGANSLKGLSIDVLRGSNFAKQVSQLERVKVVDITSYKTGLRKLNKQRTDLVAGPIVILQWHLKQLNLKSTIDVIPYPGRKKFNGIAFHKNVPRQLIDTMNQTFNEITNDGTLTKILMNYR